MPTVGRDLLVAGSPLHARLALDALFDLGDPGGKLLPLGPAGRLGFLDELKLVQENGDRLVAGRQLGAQPRELLAGSAISPGPTSSSSEPATSGWICSASSRSRSWLSSRAISSCSSAMVSRYSDSPGPDPAWAIACRRVTAAHHQPPPDSLGTTACSSCSPGRADTPRKRSGNGRHGGTLPGQKVVHRGDEVDFRSRDDGALRPGPWRPAARARSPPRCWRCR